MLIDDLKQKLGFKKVLLILALFVADGYFLTQHSNTICLYNSLVCFFSRIPTETIPKQSLKNFERSS